MSNDECMNTSPVVLSMDVDEDGSFESEYRLQIGNKIKYLTICPGTFDRDTLSFPIPDLPPLPYDEEWTGARLSRDKVSGNLEYHTYNRMLPGIENPWHHNLVNCLDLTKTEQLTATALEAVTHSAFPGATSLPTTVIAKIARFEWEMPRIEQETEAYRLLEGTGLAPSFLGHIHENGRIMGFLLEKLQGRFASSQDLSQCEAALRRLHGLGILHGDTNRYNFLVTEDGVKLLDFEHFQECAAAETLQQELDGLRVALSDESGRGGGFMFTGDDS